VKLPAFVLPLLSLCLLSPLLLKSSPLSAASKATLTLKFPKSQSIGRLYRMEKDEEWILDGEFTKTYIGGAQGEVVVPANTPLYLDLSPVVAGQPQLMEEGNDRTGICNIRMRAFLEDPAPIFTHMDKFKSLQRLDMISCDVSEKSLGALKSRTELQRLNFNGCAINGSCIESLTGLKKLRMIDLSTNTLLPATYKNLAKIHSLESVNLARTQMTNADVEAISTLPNITILGIGQNAALNGSCLKYLRNLKHLKHLNITETTIRNRDLLQLKGLPLTQVNLGGTVLASPDKVELKKAFPRCTFVPRGVRPQPELETLLKPLHH